MNILTAHIEAAIMGGTPGSSGNPIYVNLQGPSPYTIAIVSAIFAVLAAIVGSVAAFTLANHAQENRDRSQRFSLNWTSYLEVDQKLWAFAVAADNLIERLRDLERLRIGAAANPSLKSVDMSELVLLAAGTGLDFRAVEPLIRDAYKLREDIDWYTIHPTQGRIETLKATTRLVRGHLQNARDMASTQQRLTRVELNNIARQMRTRPERGFFGLGQLKN